MPVHARPVAVGVVNDVIGSEPARYVGGQLSAVSILEECLALKQREGQRSKSCHAFLPEGIQIEDLTQASCHA